MMKKHELLSQWKAEEAIAHIHGWDFTHIAGRRYTEEGDLPWDYRATVLAALQPQMKLLDLDTGGGEFLLSLGHPHRNTSATEAYPPNVRLCRETLAPLGVDIRDCDAGGALPFDDASFDVVMNRHGAFNAGEIRRVLKNGGRFITQQVGAWNDRELVALLMGELPLPFPQQTLDGLCARFRAEGLHIRDARECYRPIRFYDVGALVWFARVIEWEFPGFSVERCEAGLMEAQRIVEREGSVEGRIHRLLLDVTKD